MPHSCDAHSGALRHHERGRVEGMVVLRLIRRRLFLVSAGLLIWLVALASFVMLADLPDPKHANGQTTSPSILILDRHGRLLYEVIDPNGSKHVPLPLADIPLTCRQAIIATEDSRFYQHRGVDLLAIVRTAWLNRNDLAAMPGASTLTQQLARNLYLPADERSERSLRRKLREAWLAWRLEQRYSKDEVLALYLNTTYFGHFAVGIEAAAQAYFGVHARDLDLAQCTLLAGLPQYPAGYNPLENPEAARFRQKVVLGLMVKDGHISQGQAEDALGERLAYASAPFAIEAPHFVMWAQAELERLVGRERVRGGGLRVTTTLDLDWQRQAEEIVRRRLAQLRPCAAGAHGPACDPAASPDRRVDHAALVSLDPQTGAVLAMVGSPDYFDAGRSGAVNASLALRQPGSAIKPLTYAAAFDPERAARAGQQPWTAATLIADLRTVFLTAEGEPYVPHNYDLTYHGPVLARAALANSYNIPAVKALQFIGVDALVDQAARMGIPLIADFRLLASRAAGLQSVDSPLANPQFGLALTLGGGEVRLLDLTAAYAAFANGGQRVTPFGIERIETLDGETIADCKLQTANTDESEARSTEYAIRTTQYALRTTQYAIDSRVAYLISDILSDNIARIPSFGEQSALEIGRPAAAKTGTTSDWRDNWTVGYTPDLATGVWVGNADNAPMKDVSGVTGAGPIWRDFMTSVLRNTPPRHFARPDGLVRVEVCADSGLLPGDSRLRIANGQMTDGQIANRKSVQSNVTVSPGHPVTVSPCPHRRFEWFITGTEPTEVDEMHRQIAFDVRTGQPAGDDAPLAAVRWQTVWVMPDQYREWAAENGIPQPLLPGTLAPTFQPPTSNFQHPTSNLQLASPDPNRTYRIDPGLPLDVQKLPISARPGLDLLAQGAPITLLVDGAPIATLTGPEHTAWWQLARGRHTFQAVATGRDGVRVTSEEVEVYVE
ncbi:MAG: penicillin-binding protein [Chloroflexi bacterium]|nr:penicillin-binding protein [Chloroflexota bacterium]